MKPFTSAKLQGLIGKATALNATQKAMLHAACRWIDWNTLEFWPSVESWARLASLSGETIRKHCRALEAIGVIVVESRSRGGRSQSNRYRLVPSALTAVEPTLFDAVGCAVKHPTSDRETPNLARRNPQSGAPKPPTTLPLPIQRTIKPPQPPRTRGNIPDLESAPAGGGRGGEFQSNEAKATPAATPARRVECDDAPTTRKASQGTPRASEAINASGANPVVEALVALTVPRNEAEELAAIPHVDLSLVAFVAAEAERNKATIKRPARWIAKLVRGGPGELEGWDAHLAKQRERERRLCSTLIARASHWAHEHAHDQVYRPFIASAVAAIKAQFPSGWAEAVRDGSLHPSVIRPDATSVEVLASLAASCGVDLEIPTDTLRMPEARGEVAQPRSQVQ